MPTVDPTHQLVILARLNDFCQFRGATLHHEKDPWGYMLRKIAEVEEPLTSLKKELFAATRARLLEEMKGAAIDEERFTDYRTLFERLLAPGDFADLAIHLTTQGPEMKVKMRAAEQVLAQVKPHTGFDEERKPPAERSVSWEKLINELHKRLDLNVMSDILKRKPRTRRRKAYVLRRMRRNVAEYCTVLRIPTDPADTFTPFMLPRIEALVAACWRFLSKNR